jgi:hypothetical protein
MKNITSEEFSLKIQTKLNSKVDFIIENRFNSNYKKNFKMLNRLTRVINIFKKRGN